MDYEKKYKEALEWARKVMQGKVGFVLDEVLEKFPELKESEDEKIRNQIIEHIKWSYDEYECAEEEMHRWIAWLENQGEQKDILKDVILDSNEDGLIAETIKVGKAKKSQRMESAKAKEALLNDVSKKDQHSNEESPCLREIVFQYHTPSASLLPYREEHNMLVDLDCANLLRLICKNLSSLQAHEVHPWLAYLAGVFEGLAQLRQRMIEQQKNNGI